MNQYPKWLYRRDGKPVLVQDAEAHKALGEGWAETPAAFIDEPKAALEELNAALEKPKGKRK